MPTRPIIRRLVPALAVLAWLGGIGPAAAEDKSYYSPIIQINAKQGYIVIAADGKVFGVAASEEAKPHLDKLPVGGMLDLVVELKAGDDPPVIKRWKLMSGESACKVFDGKSCK